MYTLSGDSLFSFILWRSWSSKHFIRFEFDKYFKNLKIRKLSLFYIKNGKKALKKERNKGIFYNKEIDFLYKEVGILRCEMDLLS